MKFLVVVSVLALQQFVWALGNANAPKTGVYNLGISAEPSLLNPITTNDAFARMIISYSFESLLDRNSETYEYEPALAESWSISKDGSIFTFKLRKDAKWHDGKPLTAKDVKFSFDAINNPAYQTFALKPYYENLEYCKVIDDYTVEFKAKTIYWQNFDSAASIAVWPQHIYGDAAKAVKINKTYVGSGPYKLEKWQQGQKIILTRNTEWWGAKQENYKNQFNFDKIQFRFARDENVRLEMLKRGDLDFMELRIETFMTKTNGEPWGTKLIKQKVANKTPKSHGFVAFNLRKEIFKDKNVRLALAHAMNRDLINQKFRYGQSELATGPWDKNNMFADPKQKAIAFDIKKSAQLLKDAGWTDADKNGILEKNLNGTKTELRFNMLNPSPDAMKMFTVYKEDAKKIGIEINLQQIEWNAFVKQLDDGKFDTVVMAWSGGSQEIDPKQIWHSASAVVGGSNFINYKNTEVDKLIDEARSILDKKKRQPVLQKAYRLIADDIPYIFLFNDKNDYYGVNSRIGMEKPTYTYSLGTSYWWIK